MATGCHAAGLSGNSDSKSNEHPSVNIDVLCEIEHQHTCTIL